MLSLIHAWKVFAAQKRPPLGRWCHPSSDAYAHCDQERKALHAMYDNGFATIPRARNTHDTHETHETHDRDPISVLVVDTFGT